MNFLSSISLITAFVGGMVALFAPCCITFLLPSYLANIFRHKTSVIAMTVLFALGLATVLVPTALGIRAVGQIFQQYHVQTYVAGGLFMILLGLMELTGKKITLPMINLTIDLNAHKSAWAVYVLGIFSGLTTSCCTPVLAGILTLSFLSPNFFWAAMAATAYVAGMVVPLVILALLLEKIKWDKLPLLRTKTLVIGKKHILVSDIVAGSIFTIVGVVIIALALSGNIVMSETEGVATSLGWAYGIVRAVRAFPGAEAVATFLIGGGIVFFVYRFIKERKKL